MATGVAEVLLRCVFDSSISMHDVEIERRPYHRNCGCALHELKGVCFSSCSLQRNVSFPRKQAPRSLSLTVSSLSSQSSVVSNVS